MFVGTRFEGFLKNIALTDAQVEDGITKHTGVRTCLNKHYWGVDSGYSNSMLLGSWGKFTRVRPVRDIDILFSLPLSVYERFQKVTGNRQSQLLQEVKNVLSKTYTSTKMRGDGQVVVVPFVSQPVEVVPAFLLNSGQYYICDTNDGGRYKTIDPNAEIKGIADSDSNSSGNTRHLARMLKKWQETCGVPLKSYALEALSADFLSTWQYRGKGYSFYDWMSRDFFGYMVNKSNGYVFVPGSYDLISLGSEWKSRAESAQKRAIKGCEFEAQSKDFDAWWEWQNIFGDDVPHD